MSDTKWISEAGPSNFEQEVIERSKQVPVLADFWAPWCAPCRVLTPVLESLIADREGALWLVKVNIDQSQSEAVKYGVQSVPTVKLFVDGKIRGGFTGAVNRRSIEEFLDRQLPKEDEKAYQAAETLFDEGSLEEVEATLKPALESRTFGDRARLLLARSKLQLNQLDSAEKALEGLTAGTDEYDRGQAMLLRVDMVRAAEGHDVAELVKRREGNKKDSDAAWALAGLYVQQGKHREALETLLELLQADRSFRNDGARRAMLALFDEIGIHHELSRHFRKQLAIYL